MAGDSPSSNCPLRSDHKNAIKKPSAKNSDIKMRMNMISMLQYLLFLLIQNYSTKALSFMIDLSKITDLYQFLAKKKAVN